MGKCKTLEKKFIKELAEEIRKKGVEWIEYIEWPEGARAIKTNIGHIEEMDEKLANLIDKLVRLDLDWKEIDMCESEAEIDGLKIKHVIMC